MTEYGYHQCSLRFDTKKRKNVSFTAAGSEFYIDIRYSCMPIFSDWILPEDSEEPQLLRRVRSFTSTEHIRLNLEQFSNEEKAREIIGNATQLWPVCDINRPSLIDFALRKAREFVESMPPSHNAGYINLRVRPELKYVFDERLAVRLATRQSTEEAEIGMVPAMEWSIELLESTSLMESGSCVICLEEFVIGGEGVTMPCSHIFHEDCIKKWLRTSHYCPICRYQMPTN
ncbi:Ubiquitin--protein ligase [Handroanthus impetiginosus]|uniref:RING-type E3 ubiquitin transferase n=1 Tax=Handroanthus impetiginosus TaxID=429701 RepID=A0A2G9HI83_9LAMI|nr:Ubiquitin--protein ligase [Handroanthus impetiginosus]